MSHCLSPPSRLHATSIAYVRRPAKHQADGPKRRSSKPRAPTTSDYTLAPERMHLLPPAASLTSTTILKRGAQLVAAGCIPLIIGLSASRPSSAAIIAKTPAHHHTMSTVAMSASTEEIDPVYPGTAVARMLASRARVRELSAAGAFSGDWATVRRNLLSAAGLRDLPNAAPGQGYTGHAFNDFNHCDATTMRLDVADANNDGGKVPGIAVNNPLGNGIRIASLPELGPGGSWSTCLIGSNQVPPHDVAHVQFQSRIAFKLVWNPPDFNTFSLVDDDGALLARGTPTGRLPPLSERQRNYLAVQGGKYDVAKSAQTK